MLRASFAASEIAWAPTQVHIRSNGQAATRSVTSRPNTTPIINVRNGWVTNRGLENQSVATCWTGPMSSSLYFTCGTAATWPSVRHERLPPAVHRDLAVAVAGHERGARDVRALTAGAGHDNRSRDDRASCPTSPLSCAAPCSNVYRPAHRPKPLPASPDQSRGRREGRSGRNGYRPAHCPEAIQSAPTGARRLRGLVDANQARGPGEG